MVKTCIIMGVVMVVLAGLVRAAEDHAGDEGQGEVRHRRHRRGDDRRAHQHHRRFRLRTRWSRRTTEGERGKVPCVVSGTFSIKPGVEIRSGPS